MKKMVLLILPMLSWARLYNYQDLPVGESNVGMGTASVAVLHGDVGNMYYNPATLAYAEGTQITASLTAYNRYDIRTGEYVTIFESAVDNLSRGGFLAVPSLVGGQVRMGQWVWGGGLMVPDSFENSGAMSIGEGKAVSFRGKSEALWAGTFVARPINPDWNVGVSLFYVSPSIEENFLFVEAINDTEAAIEIFDRSISYSGLVFLLGTTYRVNDDLYLGASFRAPIIGLSKDGSYIKARSGLMDQNTFGEFELNYIPMPMRGSLGISWKGVSDWHFAADIHAYDGKSGHLDPEGIEASFNWAAKPVVNFSLGADWAFRGNLHLRAGAFTNMSSAKDVGKYTTTIDDKVHMFGGTFSIVMRQPTGTLTLGGFVQAGQGKAMSLKDPDGDPVARSNYFYGALVGSNYVF